MITQKQINQKAEEIARDYASVEFPLREVIQEACIEIANWVLKQNN